MHFSSLKVEQINSDLTIVEDYGEILTDTEISDIVIKCFPNTYIKDGYIFGRYNKTDFCLFIKNITYLGNPHPISKKRIQIPQNFKRVYEDNNNKNIRTLLLGIYKYKDVIIFCNFDTNTYVYNNLNNSSAHINTTDLKIGLENGFFKKRDVHGNEITLFTVEKVNDFYKSIFEYTAIELKFEIIRMFDKFFELVPKKWSGIEILKEMLESKSNDIFHDKWIDLYLETLMSKYIKEHNLLDVVRYEKDKKDNEIDLDLYFSKIDSYGILKMHNESLSEIIGNNKETVKKLIQNRSIYYVICNYDIETDMNNNFKVEEIKAKIKNNLELLSHISNMRYKVNLKNYYILEINKYNYQHVDFYTDNNNNNLSQGKNKILICNENIEKFLIHYVEFNKND